MPLVLIASPLFHLCFMLIKSDKKFQKVSQGTKGMSATLINKLGIRPPRRRRRLRRCRRRCLMLSLRDRLS